MKYLGNQELLKKTAFLASTTIPLDMMLNCYDWAASQDTGDCILEFKFWQTNNVGVKINFGQNSKNNGQNLFLPRFAMDVNLCSQRCVSLSVRCSMSNKRAEK